MKCLKCGFELEGDFGFCPQCGQPLTAPVPENLEMPTVLENPAAKRTLALIKDGMFLAVAILISIATILSFGNGIPVFLGLSTIFLWLLYAKGVKNTADSTQIRNISGTVYAVYIVNYVLVGFVAVLGLLCAGIMAIAGNVAGAMDEFEQLFDEMDFNIAESIGSISAVIIIILFGIICAIVLLYNILGIRNIHKFIKSVYMSVDSGIENYHKPSTARAWLLALGILEVVSAVASKNLVTIIATACGGAAMIIASILIEKYFVSMKEQPQLQEPTVNE